jgi:general secretion pathway protein M
VPTFKSEQSIAIAALALLFLACISAAILSLQSRADARQYLDEKRELLARLEAHLQSRAEASGQSAAIAPAAAFLEAPTPGLASAKLQAYLAQLLSGHDAVLISSGEQQTSREDQPDSIRIEASLDIAPSGLQAMLYRLEAGTPYVFVDSLAVQPASAAKPGGSRDPLLHVTLGLRSIWQRGAE